MDEPAVFLPVGRLQSARSAFLGALPGPKLPFISRTALFKPLGLARANTLDLQRGSPNPRFVEQFLNLR